MTALNLTLEEKLFIDRVALNTRAAMVEGTSGLIEKIPPVVAGALYDSSGNVSNGARLQALALLKSFAGAVVIRNIGEAAQPPFQNGWLNFGSPYGGARFYKDALGYVVLEGLIASGTLGTVAFTLPQGFWPDVQIYQATVANNVLGTIVVDVTGGVTIANVGANNFVSLWGIRFRAQS